MGGSEEYGGDDEILEETDGNTRETRMKLRLSRIRTGGGGGENG